METKKLQLLMQKLEQDTKIDDGTWLDHLNPSQAFLTCIGAGPWKVKRRNFIQKQAVTALGGKDLSEISDVGIFKYPLDWQKQKVKALIEYLHDTSSNMYLFTTMLRGTKNPVKILYDITKTKGRAKVLDLFARDYLKAPSFPIDRHVERVLKENGFPIKEDYMIKLCDAAGLNPSHVARAFVAANGKFTGNGNT